MKLAEKLRYVKYLGETGQRPGRFLASRALWRTRLCRLVTVHRDGYAIRFHPTQLSANLWWDPNDRAADEEFIRRYLRPGGVVIDAGANIGNLTLAAAHAVGTTGAVFAIEPQRKIYAHLCNNVRLNQLTQVTTICVALGVEPKDVSLTTGRSDTENRVARSGRGQHVRQERLDDLLPSIPSVELLKLDVEGYELRVLQGAGRTLEKTKCVYYETSVGAAATYGYEPPDLHALLAEGGFSLLRLVDRKVVRASIDYAPTVAENLVAVRDIDDFLMRTGYTLTA